MIKYYLSLVNKFPESKEEPSKELKYSLKILKWKINPKKILFLNNIILILSIIISIFSLIFKDILIFVSTVIIALSFSSLIIDLPKLLARKKLKSENVNLVNSFIYLISFLKRNPNLEKAIISMPKEGLIGEIFKRTIEYGKVDKKLIEEFEIINYFYPSLRKIIFYILSALKEKSEIKRNLLLEKALNFLLEEINDENESYLEEISLPILTIIGLGAVFPLTILGSLPILAFFSLRINSILYLFVASLALIFNYSIKVAIKRPILPNLGYNIKINKKQLFIIPIILSFPFILYLLQKLDVLIITLPFIPSLSLTFGISTPFFVLYLFLNKKIKIIEKMRKEYEELINLLYQAVLLFSEGMSFEKSLEEVYKSTKNKNISEIISFLKKGIFYSPKLDKFTNNFFNLFRKEGGITLWESFSFYANYLTNLFSVRKKIMNKYLSKISSIRITYILFVPLISGFAITTTNLIMEKNLEGFLPKQNIDFEFLISTFGIFIILFSAVMENFVNEMIFGSKYYFIKEYGKNLFLAIIIYTTTLIISYLLFPKI